MTKDYLISQLQRDKHLKSKLVTKAFEAVDRVDFVPREQETYAYVNSAISIGFQQTISQPQVVAFLLELLSLKKGEKVLDIGSGSGWQAALLSHIVGQSGKVIAVERLKSLIAFSEENLKKYPTLKRRIELIHADGAKGHSKDAPYDKIVAAAAVPVIPKAWKDQVKIGGKIVAPVESSIVCLEKVSARKFEKKEYYGFAFVPLISRALDKKAS